MNESDGSNDVPPVAVAAPPGLGADAGTSVASAHGVASTAVSPDSVRGMDPADRPGASGHRFGPDLACSECGMQWDAHQRSPEPCAKDEMSDAFLRRPVVED